MKKSLIISEHEKYGVKPPPAGIEGSADEKKAPRKFAPTITLTGSQVDAFCGCQMKVGQKGSATVHFVVKAASAGDAYGEDVPSKKADQKLTLSLTHVEADDKSGGKKDDEEEDNSEEEKNESVEEEKAEGEDDADESGEGAVMDKVSPKDTGLDD